MEEPVGLTEFSIHLELYANINPEHKVRIRSKSNAARPQRFTVQARPEFIETKPDKKNVNRWVPLGTYNGDEYLEFSGWSVNTTYRIVGEHHYEVYWRSSKPSLWGTDSESKGKLVMIYFEDDTPGDGDFDDLIIQIDFGKNFDGIDGLVDVPPELRPRKSGGGVVGGGDPEQQR